MSEPTFSKEESSDVLDNLNHCLNQLKPHEIIEYTLFAVKTARNFEKDY